MKVNGKHLDLGLKVFLSILVTIFIFLFKDTKTDVKEIRRTSHKIEVELEKLKLEMKLRDVLPPPEKSGISMEDLGEIVKMLKNHNAEKEVLKP